MPVLRGGGKGNEVLL
ncbi:hypothetical protein [Escherichia coli]